MNENTVGNELGVPVVRVHTFQVGKDNVAIKRVLVFGSSVVDHRIGDCILVFTDEVASASWTCLLEGHARHATTRERYVDASTDRESPMAMPD